jgi:hypothetical protein
MEDASLALVEEVMDDEEPRPKAIAGTKKKPVPPSPKKLSNNTFMNICMQLIKVAISLHARDCTHTHTHTHTHKRRRTRLAA